MKKSGRRPMLSTTEPAKITETVVTPVAIIVAVKSKDLRGTGNGT